MRSHAKAPLVGSISGTDKNRLRRVLVLTAALFVVLISAGPAQAATRAKLAELGAPFNTGAGGALSGIASVAVNRTGAGGVGAGDVYVADSGNNRISEFSASGTFVRTWGYDVVSSGPDNTGGNERQTIQVKATGGAFSLAVTTATGVGTRTVGSTTVTGVSNTFGTFHVGDAIAGTGIPSFTRIVAVGSGTLTLSQAATAASSLEMTATENTGATGAGNLTAGSSEITALVTRTGEFAVGKTITATGIPVGTTIVAVGAGTLTLSNPVEAGKSGTGIALTATNIPYNASAAQLQTALEALAGVDPGDIVAAGGPGDATGSIPYTATFSGGRFAGNDLAELGQSAAGLPGGSVTIATPAQGGGAEVCKAVSSPADVCKKGTSSTMAGGLAGPSGIAADQATGNVYVYSGNAGKRVDAFSAKGVFGGAFGRKLISNGAAGTGTLSAGSTSVTAVATTSRAFLVGQTIAGAGIPVGTTITAVGANTNTITLSQPATASGASVALTVSAGAGNVPQNETQKVTIGGAPSGGTFTLTFKALRPSEASATATAIPFNASAAEVQAKLEGLANIDAGNVEVSGAAGGPYAVEFKGTRYADTDVFEMTASGAGLTPSGTVTIATTAAGGGAFEFCTTASGCLAGEGSAAAGGFAASNTPRNLSVGASGDLYVPDPGNRRFDVFKPTLNGADEVIGASFLRAVGWGVADGNTSALQSCTSTCFKGISGNGAGQLSEGLTAAIADAGGNVYTVTSVGNCGTETTCRIQKFNPDGSIANAGFGPSTGECSTVRTSGFVSGPSGSGVLAVAVDPVSGNVLAFTRITSTTERICEFDSSGNELGTFPAASLTSATAESAGLAVGTAERVYAGHGNVLTVLGPVPPPSAEILPASEIGQTTAKLNGKVTVPSPGGEGFNTTYRFEVSSDAGFHWSKVPALDVSVGSTAGTFEVHQVATGLQPNLNYLVRLVATTGPGVTSGQEIFKTLAAPPTVEIPQTASPVATETTAKLKGLINPNNSTTSYHFEHGITTSYGEQSPDFDPFVGSDGQPVGVGVKLTSLLPGTVYHYRLVAANAAGTTKGEDRQFKTVAVRDALSLDGLPDDRGIELVSPADKQPVGLVGYIVAGEGGQMLARAAEDGGSLIYPLVNGTADSTAGGFLRERAIRTPAGWLSSQVSAPSLIAPPDIDGVGIANPSTVYYASPDLSCAILTSYNPLTEDTPQVGIEQGVVNLYRWNEDGSYELISNRMPLNPSIGGVALLYSQIDASDDCSRVYFRSPYNFLSGASGLYEWDEGTLRDAGVLPNGAPGNGAVIGGETIDSQTSRWNAVSPDGSRLFFSAISNEGPDSGTRAVFMRVDSEKTDDVTCVTTPKCSIKISQSETGVPTSGARFETASPDGRQVFFRANYGIAATTSSGPTNGACAETTQSTQNKVETRPCDLYGYDVSTGELTDLSADSNPADTNGAVVQGTVAVSDDGSHVYFAATGQLTPGEGKTDAQNNLGQTSANIYLFHAGALSFVTNLGQRSNKGVGNGDLLGPSDTNASDLVGAALMRMNRGWVTNVTADGKKLLFVASANITGYESGGIQEAYLYSADSGEVVCISCRPDGLPSVYTPDLEPKNISDPDRRPPLARMISNSGTTVSYRPRSMNEDGTRIFFTSPDVLAPGGVAGAKNVYEWEEGQVYFLAVARPSGGSGIGQYLDSSVDGDDVFIATGEKLAPQDVDIASDVYDLRVGGGFAFEEPPVACNPANDECQGTPSPQPSPASPSSASFSGPGNPPASGQAKKPRKKKHKKKAKKRNQKSRSTKSNRGGAK